MITGCFPHSWSHNVLLELRMNDHYPPARRFSFDALRSSLVEAESRLSLSFSSSAISSVLSGDFAYWWNSDVSSPKPTQTRSLSENVKAIPP